jgi:predicted Rossmann fold flavoprotein
MKKVIIIGGGPAGMISAIISARKGNTTVILEKNEKLGKKLYITGKGRCNLTNNSSVEEVCQNIITNANFIKPSIEQFTPTDVISFFEDLGLSLKTERGKRVFPSSDKASDVTKVLEKEIKNLNIEVKFNTTVTDLIVKDKKVEGVITNKGNFNCDSLIIATGGLSYPTTGSTGDGYKFAKKCGHKIKDVVPALNGIVCKYPINNANNLTLKNVTLTAKKSDRLLYTEQGELMLTDYGISGPIGITCSSYINRQDLLNVKLYLDFKPALSNDKLFNRISSDFRQFDGFIKDVLRKLLPKEVILPVLQKAGIYANKGVKQVNNQEILKLVDTVKNFVLLPTALRDIKEAIVTAGGVDVLGINRDTLESKHVKGLFFAGEVLDIDALTGGFNIQIALSTGYVACNNA